MEIVCLDLEGVLVPEIWINVANITGIEELKLTTRDISDYDLLMQRRLKILKQHNLGLKDIQTAISKMSPLPGSFEFLKWLRRNFQVAILSDTFYDFATPLMEQLEHPMLLCHRLVVNEDGMIDNYSLRQKDAKLQAVKAFRRLKYRVLAAGDSYNDTAMLSEADVGILFCPPDNVVEEFPHFPVAQNYDELQKAFINASKRRF